MALNITTETNKPRNTKLANALVPGDIFHYSDNVNEAIYENEVYLCIATEFHIQVINLFTHTELQIGKSDSVVICAIYSAKVGEIK